MASREPRTRRAVRACGIPERWRREMRTVVRRLAEGFSPERIILFGSSVRGTIGPHSDLDLLIVKNSRLPFHRRAAAAYRTLRGVRRRVPVEILVYTEGELEHRRALGDHFVLDALGEGEVVYERKPKAAR